MEFWEALLLAGFTGAISTVGTVAAIKVDIRWILKTIEDHGTRLTKLEEKTSC